MEESAPSSMQVSFSVISPYEIEHALDPTYAEKLGVQVNDLYVSQPDSGEQALEITDSLVRSNTMDVIVVDSVAALVPKAEVEGAMGDQHMALQVSSSPL